MDRLSNGVRPACIARTERDGVLALQVTHALVIAIVAASGEGSRSGSEEHDSSKSHDRPLSLVRLRRGQFGLDDVTIRPLEAPAAFYIIGILLLHFRLAHHEEVDVIGRQPRIERRCETLAGHHRRDEPRRYDDDQIRLLLLVGRTAEQRAEDRHRANPGYLREVVGILAGQQPRDREALAVAQFDGCRRTTRRQPWNDEMLHRLGPSAHS